MTRARRAVAPPTRVFTLDNGLIVAVQTDRSAPLVALSLTYRVGSFDEERGRAGFAHLFEHLMFQGTGSLEPNELSRLVESLGGSDNAYTMKSNTTYHEVVPTHALETVVWAEADRMRGLRLTERELAVEKEVVLEELRQTYLNQPYRRATDAEMGALAFERWESAHSTIGDPDDLRAATLADARRFYDRHYAPDNAALVLAGDLSAAEGLRLARRHFGPLKRGARPKPPRLDEPRPKEERRRVVRDHLARLPLTVVGWRAPKRGGEDWRALILLMTVLGGGEDSPLHEALVKTDRLAVSAGGHMPYWSGLSAGRGPDLAAVFVTNREGAGLEETLASLERVLLRLRREGPTEEELARAKTQLERSWYEGQIALADRAQTLSTVLAFGGAPGDHWTELSRLLALDRRACARAAKRWLGARGRLVLRVDPGGPEDAPAAIPPVAAPAEAAPEPRNGPRPPAPPPPRPARAPEVLRAELPGLEVWLAPDRRLPLVEARLAVRAGRVHEGPGQDGLAQACEELILRGRAGLDAAGVARELSTIGWSLGASIEAEWLKLSASGLARSFDAFAGQLAAQLSGASYPDDEVALWRENALHELEARRAQPHFLSEERLRRELFPGHPYGRGTADEAQIGAATPAALRAFHAARVRPGGGVLVLAGDFDPDAALKVLGRALAAWAPVAPPPPPPPLPGHGAARVVVVDRPGSTQASLVLALTSAVGPKDPDYMSLAVANHVLGGTANSRLFENLRTRRGYTYGAYSSLELYGRGAVWSASADCRTEVAGPALAELRAELSRLREEPLPEDAVEHARRHLRGLFVARLASHDRLAAYLAAVAESGRDPREALASYETRLAAVTGASARAAARERLDPARAVAVVVGEASALKV